VISLVVSILLMWLMWRWLLRPCLSAPIYLEPPPPPPPQITVHVRAVIVIREH
jgi:hypothetical protein